MYTITSNYSKLELALRSNARESYTVVLSGPASAPRPRHGMRHLGPTSSLSEAINSGSMPNVRHRGRLRSWSVCPEQRGRKPGRFQRR